MLNNCLFIIIIIIIMLIEVKKEAGEGRKEIISVFIKLGWTTHRSFPFDNP